jgi:RNA polymerase sigma-70 factor, ECF subfamily
MPLQMNELTRAVSQPLSGSHDSLSDSDLIAKWKLGNQAAFEILYKRYGKLVYNLASKILNHPQEAEEITQDIFLSLWRQEQYNPQRGSLSSYLCLLTRSRAIDRVRSRNSRQKVLERWQHTVDREPGITPFENANLWERQAIVRQAIKNLPPAQRQVLEMSYFSGLNQAEIAKQLSIPVGTVKSRSRQGLIKMGQLLQHSLE